MKRFRYGEQFLTDATINIAPSANQNWHWYYDGTGFPLATTNTAATRNQRIARKIYVQRAVVRVRFEISYEDLVAYHNLTGINTNLGIRIAVCLKKREPWGANSSLMNGVARDWFNRTDYGPRKEIKSWTWIYDLRKLGRRPLYRGYNDNGLLRPADTNPVFPDRIIVQKKVVIRNFMMHFDSDFSEARPYKNEINLGIQLNDFYHATNPAYPAIDWNVRYTFIDAGNRISPPVTA